jgi:protein SCO1/2
MFRLVVLLLGLALGASAHAENAAEADALAAVKELGSLNGLALACRQPALSERAKRLMIDYVPKLREWGEVYETATTTAFLTPSGACPEAAALRVRIELVAARLGQLLPASPRLLDTPAPDDGITPRYLLQGPDGRAVSDGDFQGRFQLIAFGYTYCPDICPTTLVSMAHILKLLGDDAKRVQPIFISVDPERDTPAQLKAYTQFFDARILGLTGSPELVRRTADFFKVRYEKVLVPGAAHYSIDHSAGLYLLSPGGSFITKFSYGTDDAAIFQRLREIMAL